jgi:hypothetical protein
MRRGTGISLVCWRRVPLLLACTLASVALHGVGQASAAPALPDGRAWEMVSPLEKNNSVITGIDGTPSGSYGLPQAAADGESFVYASNGAFADSASAPLAAQYLAARSASSWSTVNITPPVISDSYGLVGVGGPYRAFSADLSSGLLLNGDSLPIGNQPLPSTNAPAGYQNYYVQELGTQTGGFQAVLTSAPSEPSSALFRLELQGASPDMSHIVFSTVAALTPNATDDGYRNLYEWSDEGLRLVSITPNAVLGEDHVGNPGGLNAISDDGSVAFTDEEDLYARADGTGPAVQVDASHEGLESGEGQFQTASSEGSRIFFTDDLRLTSDSTANPRETIRDLYEYDLKSGQLSDLTVEDPEGAGVQRVLGASEDGSYVYFVASGVLAEGAAPGCCNLYVWHRDTPGDTTKFIAALSPNDESEAIENRPENIGRADDWAPTIANRTSRVAPDGLNLVFMSEESLTGYDNRSPETGQREQEVYDYDAGAGMLHCASCDPSGAPPRGASSIPAGTQFENEQAIYQSRVLSDVEGRARVFFDSSAVIIPQATNGEQDVYEWEEDGRGSCRSTGGCIALISSGTSGSESSFLDASANGSDVFFLTEAELVPQDTDQLLDIYDAREGGGLPSQPITPPGCEEEACAAPVSQAPALGAPLSASYVGLGNTPAPGSKPAVKPVHGKVKSKKESKKRKARHRAKKTRRSARARG